MSNTIRCTNIGVKTQAVISAIVVALSLLGMYTTGYFGPKYQLIAELAWAFVYITGLGTLLAAGSEWFHDRGDKHDEQSR